MESVRRPSCCFVKKNVAWVIRVAPARTSERASSRTRSAGLRRRRTRSNNMMIYRLVVLVSSVVAWDLSTLQIPQDSVRHVHVWTTRAFLSVERHDASVPATLLEAVWPEPSATGATRPPRAFPLGAAQPWGGDGGCEGPQSSLATATDSRARLWLLDKGSGLCPPKIIIYDLLLLKNNKVLSSAAAPSGLGVVTTMCVDSVGQHGPRAYVGGGDGAAAVAVYALKERRWWLLRLSAQASTTPPPPPGVDVEASDLALGRWHQGALYLTGPNTDSLFSISLQELRATPAPPVADSRAAEVGTSVRWLGRKLGPSTCLGADQRGGVLYLLARDAAVVRWDSRRPLQAEAHAVLMQNSTLLASDSVRQLWAATSSGAAPVWALLRRPTPPSNKHCLLINKTTPLTRHH